MIKLRISRPLRVAVLVKQIPKFEEMELSSNGRLVRDGVELHMNDYCRRGVRVGCEIAQESGGTCTAITLGPPEADTVLREAILCGSNRGLHVCDPAFAGSDTLATSLALAAVLKRHGPWDLVLCGRNSIDSDTGQVPAQLAELLGLPLLVGVRELEINDENITATLEHDDEWLRVKVGMPALLSCAERLCDPCKIKDPEIWATVEAKLIETVPASDLGPGPWGLAASPTNVGRIRVLDDNRAGERVENNRSGIDRVVSLVVQRLSSREVAPADFGSVPLTGGSGPAVWVLAEPGRERTTAELVGAGARLAANLDGGVAVTGPSLGNFDDLAIRGADRILKIEGIDGADEANLSQVLTGKFLKDPPWAILCPSTDWGRHLAGRLAVQLKAGLTGDAVGVEVRDGRLISLKPAFGGRLVAEISYSSPIQMATIRPGVLPLSHSRPPKTIPIELINAEAESPIQVVERWKDDDSTSLMTAQILIGVGRGVEPSDYQTLNELAGRIQAVLCATRKVTDLSWMPRSRQVGITGHSVAPQLFLAVGTSGRFNHMVGVRSAGTIVGINNDPTCELWTSFDIGILGDWHEVLQVLIPRLVEAGIASHLTIDASSK